MTEAVSPVLTMRPAVLCAVGVSEICETTNTHEKNMGDRTNMKFLSDTHLNCSEVMLVPPEENFLSRNTIDVVKTENKAPNPMTTR